MSLGKRDVLSFGATSVRLGAATKAILRPALAAAWGGAAPKKLAREFEAGLK